MNDSIKKVIAGFLGDAFLFLAGCMMLVAAVTCLAFTGSLCAKIAVACWHVFF